MDSFDPEAMERRTPYVRNVVVVIGKRVISIKSLLVDHLRTLPMVMNFENNALASYV